MPRTIAPVNAPLVQAVATATADSIVERDSNRDSAFNHMVGTVGRTGEGEGIYLATDAKSGDYTPTEEDYLILMDASAATRTVNLPAAATSSGLVLKIKRVDSGANAFVVVIDANAAETIDGDAQIWLTLQYEEVELHCDGSNWSITNRFIPQKTITKAALFTVGGEASVYLLTAGSAYTITLPPAANWKGKRLTFKKVDAAAFGAVLDGNAAELIDGAATLALSATQWTCTEIVTDGTSWFTVGNKN